MVVSKNESKIVGVQEVSTPQRLHRLEVFVRTEFRSHKILSSPPNGGTVDKILNLKVELTHFTRKSRFEAVPQDSENGIQKILAAEKITASYPFRIIFEFEDDVLAKSIVTTCHNSHKFQKMRRMMDGWWLIGVWMDGLKCVPGIKKK